MKKNRINGFTLIEMLIAVSIFSIIAVASYYSLSNFNKSSIHLQKNIKQIEELQTFITFLDRDFSQVYNQNIIFKNSKIEIISLQNGKILNITYDFNDDKITRVEGKGNLVLMKNVSKIQPRLLDDKNKWLKKWKKNKTKYIKAIEVKFNSKFGEIIKVVIIDE